MNGTQTYLYPENLFELHAGSDESTCRTGGQQEDSSWTCVWTLPRQEKKLSKWLSAKAMAHYLPVTVKETVSHRRRRSTEQPLFPSYLFVKGAHSKKSFMDSRAVASILPAHEAEGEVLTNALRDIWQGLNSGGYFRLINQFSPGDLVEVVKGPFKGMSGYFESYNEQGALVVWINVLGVGASLELDDPTVVRPLDKQAFIQQ